MTSKLLPDLLVDSFLELLLGVPTEKLLEGPALLTRIKELLRPGRSFIAMI